MSLPIISGTRFLRVGANCARHRNKQQDSTRHERPPAILHNLLDIYNYSSLWNKFTMVDAVVVAIVADHPGTSGPPDTTNTAPPPWCFFLQGLKRSAICLGVNCNAGGTPSVRNALSKLA